MHSGWSQIKQSGKEFCIDVHAVAGNFFGEQNWNWLRESKEQEGQVRSATRWDRFTEEMMRGAQHYSNDSDCSDRIALGVATSLYGAAFYFPGRLLYDGALNAVEFGYLRTTGQARSPLHPEGRLTNGYVLGVPVAIPLITSLAIGEGIVRVAGVSSYGADVIRTGHRASAAITHRYLGSCGDDLSEVKAIADAKADAVRSLWTCPSNLTQVADRGALVTFPAFIAITEMGLAATFAGIVGSGEIAGRALGISSYGGHIVHAAFGRMCNMSFYTRGFMGEVDGAVIAADEKAISTYPKNGWEVADRVGLVTGAGLIAATEIGLGLTVTIVGGLGDGARRVLGLTPYGSHIVHAAFGRMQNMSYYTRALFGEAKPDAIAKDEKAIATCPKNAWEFADRFGLVTGAGFVAAMEIGLGATVTVAMGFGDGARRVLGATEYGGHVVKAGHHVSKKIAHRYIEKSTHPADEKQITPQQNQSSDIWTCPTSFAEGLDRGALVTFPAVIALSEMGLAVGLTSCLGSLEVCGRALGLSSYGGHVAHAALGRMRNLSRYTEKLLGGADPADIAADEAVIFDAIRNGWDAIDRIGLLTGAGAFALSEIVLGVTITATGGIGETFFRVSGVSAYGGHVIRAAGNQARNLSSYTRWLSRQVLGTDAKPADIEKDQDVIFTCPTNGWQFADRVGLVTGAGLIAATEMALGATVTVMGGLGDGARRVLGFTEYGGSVIGAGHHISRKITSRYLGSSTKDHPSVEAKSVEIENKELANLESHDHYTYQTQPVFHIDDSQDLEAGRLERVIPGDAKAVAPAETKTASQQRPQSIWTCPSNLKEGLDRGALITLPAAFALTEMGLSLGLTATMGVFEIGFRAAGVSPYGYHVVHAAFGRMRNMSSYTTALFGTPDMAVIVDKDEAAILSPPQNLLEAIDRLGIVTGAGVVALTEMGIGVTVTLLGGAGEMVGRSLGISEYGVHVVHAANGRMRNMSCYTRGILGAESSAAIAADEKAIATCPRDVSGVFDRLGLFTGAGFVAACEMGLGVTITVVVGVLDGTRRVLGLTEYGSNVVKAGHETTLAITNIYFNRDNKPKVQPDKNKRVAWDSGPEGLVRSLEDLEAGRPEGAGPADQKQVSQQPAIQRRDNQNSISSCPKNFGEVLDRGALITFPSAIAITEIGLGLGLTVAAESLETLGRLLSISDRSFNLYAYTGAKIGNMYGVTDPAGLQVNLSRVTTPIHTYWDACDSIGLVVNGIVSISACAIASVPAAIGFSVSNYHRFNHFKNQVGNMIDERREQVVHREREQYHKAQLKICEQPVAGKVFSNLNVFNAVGQGLYVSARYVAAPTVFFGAKVVMNLGGIVPAVNYVAKNCCCPTTFDLDNPFDKIKKRLADLKNSLDKYGRLPLVEGASDLKLESVKAAITETENRSLPARACFTLFSEGRKIISLGQTPEEKVLNEFSDKFDEFSRVCRRHQGLQANSFFKNDIPLENGKRFSYNDMVDRVKRYYYKPEDKARIDRVAALIRSDIDAEVVEHKGEHKGDTKRQMRG